MHGHSTQPIYNNIYNFNMFTYIIRFVVLNNLKHKNTFNYSLYCCNKSDLRNKEVGT